MTLRERESRLRGSSFAKRFKLFAPLQPCACPFPSLLCLMQLSNDISVLFCSVEADSRTRHSSLSVSQLGQGVSFHISTSNLLLPASRHPCPPPLSPSPTLHLQFRLLLNLCTLTCPVCVLCRCCCCCCCLLSLSTQICFDFNPAYALALLLHATEPAGHATGLLSLLCSDPCCLLLNTNPLMSLSLALAAHDDDYAP